MRAIIYGALGYFLLPFDVIPDFTPFIGFVEDLVILLAVAKTVQDHQKVKHEKMARDKLEEWFE